MLAQDIVTEWYRSSNAKKSARRYPRVGQVVQVRLLRTLAALRGQARQALLQAATLVDAGITWEGDTIRVLVALISLQQVGRVNSLAE